MDLKTDANGIATFLPLVEWGVNVVRGETVGLSLDYYASPEDAAAQRRTRLQVFVDAAAARQMAEGLASRADRVAGGGSGGRIVQGQGGQPR
jgi:hypothetical protein